MTKRQRFIETVTFGSPDKPASGELFGFDSTNERWVREGLPADVIDLEKYFDIDFIVASPCVNVNLEPIPAYPLRVIEETDQHIIEAKGREVVRRKKDQSGPGMPQWLSYPLQSREDWETDWKWRLDPDIPDRLPDIEARVDEYNSQEYPLGIWIGSSYGYMRNWWGVENVSTLFYDDPALIEEMIESITHLSLQTLKRVLSYGIKLDYVCFWEDMAYKGGPLISPAMFKKYCSPYYRKVMDVVTSAGIKVALVDSDGDIRQLIPHWLDVGINMVMPMEVASGMNVIEIRKEYGKRLAFFGGIDKRALAGTKEDVRKEVVPKLEACFADGGYIPACDHKIPPNVPYENYLYFRELVNEVTERFYGG